MGAGHTPYKLEDSLGYLVNRASRIIRLYLNQELKRRNFKVTGEQFAVMVHLWHSQGQTQQQLGEELSKEKTTMTRLLDSLEALDLIQRSTDTRDARLRRIYLTSNAQRTMQKLTGLAGEVLMAAQRDVAPSDLIRCKNVLRQVHQTLTQRLTNLKNKGTQENI